MLQILSLEDELWNSSALAMPVRSRLRSPKPIGIGTPYVECMTSYLARVAELQSVAPVSLMLYEIAPLLRNDKPLPEKCRSIGELFAGQTRALNGVRERACDVLAVVESLTLRNNLRFLTLLPLVEVISTNNVSLFRKNKAWCSVCFEEWKNTRQVIYDPLIWALKQIDICVKHQSSLSETCPHCQKKFDYLMGYSRPGHCPKCQSWLGGSSDSEKVTFSSKYDEDLTKRIYVATNLGNLIATSALSTLTSQDLKKALYFQIEQTTGGNIQAFCRMLNLTDGWMDSWLRDYTTLSIDKILSICYSLNISIQDFLELRKRENQVEDAFELIKTNDNSQQLNQHKAQDASCQQSKKKRVNKRVNKEEMKGALEAALKETPPPLLNEVANRIGFSEDTVKKHFPEIWEKLKRRAHHLVDERRIKRILEAALEEFPPPPWKEVVSRTGHSKDTIHNYFPKQHEQIRNRYAKYEQKERNQRIETALKAALHEEPAVPLTEVLKRIGYQGSSTEFSRSIFPDLCKQIRERYRAYVITLVQAKQEQERLLIQEAANRICITGKKVTGKLISQELAKPCILRKKHCQEKLREILNASL